MRPNWKRGSYALRSAPRVQRAEFELQVRARLAWHLREQPMAGRILASGRLGSTSQLQYQA
eukprot:341469-Alexandrium_andersonii.AAC.1